MNSENVNALSTSVIAFVTIIGFYYNLISSNIGIFYILVLQVLFLIMIFLFLLKVKYSLEN